MTDIDKAMRDAATRAGIIDLDLLPVAQPFMGSVKVNAAGKVEGATEAMAAFKKAKPALFGTSPATTGTGITLPPAEPGFNARTASPEEYAAQKRKLGLRR